MKKLCLSLLSFASLTMAYGAYAAEPSSQVPVTTSETAMTSNFTPAQAKEIEKIIGDYLTKNPSLILTSFQNAMEQQQKEALVQMEKAVAENKDKIFNNKNDPVEGNQKGSQSLVVFMDPLCGYCKKFHGEVVTLLGKNKDVKVIFKDIPIMGEKSEIAIQAMVAAKIQDKYAQLQKAIFTAEKPLTKKQIMKIATSLGIDTKKLQEDMKSKAVKDQVSETLALAKALGVNATPTLIINETQVSPGYLTADELDKKLNESKGSKGKTS